jgi:hypothetical protein
MLRAELIERGLDAVGFIECSNAVRALRNPLRRRPALIVLELKEARYEREEVEQLQAAAPVILLGGAAELSGSLVAELPWAAVLKRPVTLGAVADEVERILETGPPEQVIEP